MLQRKRIVYAIGIIITIFLGISSRSTVFPQWINLYLGDTLWAFNIFLMMGFILRNKKTTWIGILSLLFCYLIEISQLYHAVWIDNIRSTKLGGLIFGFGFLWSDILCYTTGIIIAFLCENFIPFQWIFRYE